MNLYEKKKQTDIENRAVVAKGERGWGRAGLGFEVSRCKLFCREWINHKVLLYSTGDIQFPVINHNGKEYIYVCITESLHCTAEINTTI